MEKTHSRAGNRTRDPLEIISGWTSCSSIVTSPITALHSAFCRCFRVNLEKKLFFIPEFQSINRDATITVNHVNLLVIRVKHRNIDDSVEAIALSYFDIILDDASKPLTLLHFIVTSFYLVITPRIIFLMVIFFCVKLNRLCMNISC